LLIKPAKSAPILAYLVPSGNTASLFDPVYLLFRDVNHTDSSVKTEITDILGRVKRFWRSRGWRRPFSLGQK
jgi:hypothetical protein